MHKWYDSSNYNRGCLKLSVCVLMGHQNAKNHGICTEFAQRIVIFIFLSHLP